MLGLVLSLALIEVAGPAPATSQLAPGIWRAHLVTDIGELPFRIEIVDEGNSLSAWFLNGDERSPIPSVLAHGQRVVFDVNLYDSTLRARVDSTGTRLGGEWKRRFQGDYIARIPFHAGLSQTPSVDDYAEPQNRVNGTDIDGRWMVRFAHYTHPSVGLFETRAGILEGTFINETGDYRHLVGHFEDGKLLLSRFDGAHAFLFHADLQPDGTLLGQFAEADFGVSEWSATRDPNAPAVDGFSLFDWPAGTNLSESRFVDLEGRKTLLREIARGADAIVIDMLGSWCPNCHDASVFLGELYERYRSEGLAVIGVAFEISEDFERNRAYLERFLSKNDIPYPVVMSSRDVWRNPEEVFEGVQGTFAFPTVLFLEGDGRVDAVHTGFTGPATGEAFVSLKARYEEIVRDLLRDDGP